MACSMSFPYDVQSLYPIPMDYSTLHIQFSYNCSHPFLHKKLKMPKSLSQEDLSFQGSDSNCDALSHSSKTTEYIHNIRNG